MSHLNPSPNQTKPKPNLRDRIGVREIKKRENQKVKEEREAVVPSHTPRAVDVDPLPTTHNLYATMARDHSTTAPQPSDPHATTATTKPPTQRRHHRERLAKKALI